MTTWSASQKTANRSYENVSQFKYVGILRNQNFIQEEIKRRLNSGNACYHSVLNILQSRLPSEKLKIKIHSTLIFPMVLYGCETWSLTLREEHKLRVSEYRVLRGICGGWRKLHNEELRDLLPSPSIIIMNTSRKR
jgi:hypothetical protein